MTVYRRPLSALREFLAHEAASGYVLMAAAALALIVANSPLAPVYFTLLDTHIAGVSVLHAINDGLMAIFFLLVGLEIKREILVGHLHGWRQVALPGIAAVGGMLVPALIYLAINSGDPVVARGWAIPSATDIAFALGVLALLGRRAPTSLKIFLAALAIIDDLGAIVIIAVAYTSGLNLLMLAGAGAVTIALASLNLAGVKRLWVYLGLGVALWLLVTYSGVHATLAGVILAFTIPLRADAGHAATPEGSPLHTLEHALHKPVGFLIVPLFGFANAGLSFAGMGLSEIAQPVPLGIVLGLFIGKQVGVFAFAWAAIKLRLAEAPLHATPLQMYGVSVMCGIGFTMSLFIGNLAFSDPLLLNETRLGVLVGSFLSAGLGYALLRLAPADPRAP